MLCPHCHKEIEGVSSEKPIVNLNLAAAANPMPSYLVNAVCAAQPVTFPQTVHLNLNANGCAGGYPLNLHYCTP